MDQIKKCVVFELKVVLLQYHVHQIMEGTFFKRSAHQKWQENAMLRCPFSYLLNHKVNSNAMSILQLLQAVQAFDFLKPITTK